MRHEHSNTCDLVGYRQGYNSPAVCSCGADEQIATATDSAMRSERLDSERSVKDKPTLLPPSPDPAVSQQTLPPCVNGTCLYSCADDECKKAAEKGIPWPPSADPAVSVEQLREQFIARRLCDCETTAEHGHSSEGCLNAGVRDLDRLLAAVRAASPRMRDEEQDQEDHARSDHPSPIDALTNATASKLK